MHPAPPNVRVMNLTSMGTTKRNSATVNTAIALGMFTLAIDIVILRN